MSDLITIDHVLHSAIRVDPVELSIPEWLACVKDALVVGMTRERAMTWPCDFLAAITHGADLEKIKGPFLTKVLRLILGRFDHVKYPQVVEVVNGSIALWSRKDIGSSDWWGDARCATEAAWVATASLAAEAAWNAWGAANAAKAAALAATGNVGATIDAGANVAAAVPRGSVAKNAAEAAAYSDLADTLIVILRSLGGVPDV